MLLGAGAAAAAAVSPVDAGDVVIVKAGDPSESLTRGDGNTAFLLRLPDSAVCPGDSLHDQWRVQSFMVPVGVDIGTLSYGVIGPEGAQQFALFGADQSASSFANILTPANSVAGQPGRIDAPPPFNLAVAAGEMVATGSYRIGIACTFFRATALYWDTEIEVTQAANGEPGDLSWRLPGMPAESEDQNDGGSSTLLVVGVVVSAVAVGVYVLSRNAPRRSHSLSKEPK